MQMYQNTKALREHVMAPGQSWSMNEAVLNMGQTTADNIPGQMAQIMYFIRISKIEDAERVIQGLDHFAESAAKLCHCEWKRDWVAKSRPGLANHVLAQATYDNLELMGAPEFGGDAIPFAQEVQENLGLNPLEHPFLPAIDQLTSPQDAEAQLRQTLPPSQHRFTSDDYTEYCWHAPTVRLYIGRPALQAPKRLRPSGMGDERDGWGAGLYRPDDFDSRPNHCHDGTGLSDECQHAGAGTGRIQRTYRRRHRRR